MAAPDRTSLAQIVAAGRDLLETEGLSGLTMQAVAACVGVRAPSLYKRVRDRDALLALIAAEAVEELGRRLASTEGALPELARAYRAYARDCPESFRLILAVGADLDSLHRASAPVFRVAGAAVGEAEALDAARFVTAWVTGFVTMELAGAFRLGGDVEQSFEFGLTRLTHALHSST